MSLRWFKVSEQTGISGKKKTCSKPGALITNSHDSSSKSSIWWWSKVHIRLFTGFYTSQVVQDFFHQHHDPPKYTKMSKWHACETLWTSYSCSWPHQTPRVASRLLLQVNVPAKNRKLRISSTWTISLELALLKESCIITLGSIFCEQALLVKNNRGYLVEFANQLKKHSRGPIANYFVKLPIDSIEHVSSKASCICWGVWKWNGHKTSQNIKHLWKKQCCPEKTGTISQRFVLLHFPPVIHLCSQEKCQLSSFRAGLAWNFVDWFLLVSKVDLFISPFFYVWSKNAGECPKIIPSTDMSWASRTKSRLA